MGSEEAHTGLTGTAETSRPSPRNGFTAYTCSPRWAASFATVADRLLDWLDARVAAPGPHDFAVRRVHHSSIVLPRPPHPTARSVTIASRPCRVGRDRLCHRS